ACIGAALGLGGLRRCGRRGLGAALGAGLRFLLLAGLRLGFLLRTLGVQARLLHGSLALAFRGLLLGLLDAAFHIGAFLAHFNADRLAAPLIVRGLQRFDGLALERNLARRSITARAVAVPALQERKQRRALL